jgi:uncharacterized protein (DUF58 family)
MIYPTGRGAIIIFLVASAIGVALINEGLATALVAATLASFLVASFLITLFFPFIGIKVTRLSHGNGNRTSPINLPLEISNSTFFFRQEFAVYEKIEGIKDTDCFFFVKGLKPKEKITLNRVYLPLKRGIFQLNKITLISGDPAGLFKVKKNFKLPDELAIYPAKIYLNSLSNLPIESTHRVPEGKSTLQVGKSMEFIGLRPFRNGDEIRFIDWKSTAAKHKLMVRDFESQTQDFYTIILDTCAKEISTFQEDNNLEKLIDAVSSVCNFLKSKPVKITFLTAFGKENYNIHISGDANTAVPQIEQALLELEPSKQTFPSHLSNILESIPYNSIIYVFSLKDDKELFDVINNLEEHDSSINIFTALKKDFPGSDIPIKSKPDSIKGLYTVKYITNTTLLEEVLQ